MSTAITAQLSEAAQEALDFLQEKNIDVSRMINRIVMRAAQEEGWQISLVPGAAQEKEAVEQSPSPVEPTDPEPRSGDENTHLIAPVAPTLQKPADIHFQPVVPTPPSVDKPFEPGVFVAGAMPNQDDSPRASSIVKKDRLPELQPQQ